MSKFNTFKAIVFPDQSTQNALVNAVQNKGYLATNFDRAFAELMYNVTENDLQIILAPFLRALAVKHLREGNTTFVSQFREQYDAVVGSLDSVEQGDATNVTAYLNQQSQAYVYATDIAAGALAESLGVTFACTQTDAKNFASGQPYIYYRCHSSQEPVAIVHLYNRPGEHFFVVDGQYASTIGDGNCLYNGFAQLIRQFILQEEQHAINIYINQAQIYNKINNIPACSIAELITNVRAQHSTHSDESALNAAVLMTPIDTMKNPSNSYLSLFTQEGKLLHLISLIRQQSHALDTLDHQDKANQLALALENKVTLFFNLSRQHKQSQFVTFKAECLQEITDAKQWLTQHNYQQILLDILQTLTVIGALIGITQWFITGRYSLFSTPTTTVLETIEQAKLKLNNTIDYHL
jgi:hypothetical protein